MKTIMETSAQYLSLVKIKKPLIHHITNYVTVNDCANITLALGASPIMADDAEEVDQIVSIASGLVLNIGTLNSRTIQSMVVAGKKANEKGIPVILDPVGAGASSLRNQTAKKLLSEINFAVIRGNVSEIKFIAGLEAVSKGVDVSEEDMKSHLDNTIVTAKELAKKYHCIIVVTGKTDIVTNGEKTYLIDNGNSMMGLVSGTGCMLNSIIASFVSAGNEVLEASAAAVSFMGIAGEKAYELSGDKGTGSFRVSLIDNVYTLMPDEFKRRMKIIEK